ncbi:hypothetical protein E2C01_079578 [Portunus trituberculatus]|uniref:HTH OST-type domain-containing protein n=1 Tax=Portunus trituberculatus TaxID=210409 RepID=A0A5B7IW00_PORTR|nr:hypothetical protein [Portunus trituberculatus]
MSRMRPKPDVQKLLKFINNGSNASLQQFNTLAPTKRKITTLLKSNPQGIALEKFSTAYEAEFGEWLKPSVFGYSDIVEMLKTLDDIVDMKFFEFSDQMLLFSKSEESKGKFFGGNVINRIVQVLGILLHIKSNMYPQ